ncbi:clumping factor B [Biomphalaria glabrata]
MASKSSATTTSPSNNAISASVVATTDRDTKQILLTAAVPLCVCLIGLLIVGLFKQRRAKLRNSTAQRMKATKVESSIIRRNSLSVVKKETLARDVADHYADHVYNHTENRNSNYINSSMIQYTICTEVNVDKRDIPVDTYDRYVTECNVSHLETTSQTEATVSSESDTSNDGETDRNGLNTQCHSQKLEAKATASSECDRSNDSEIDGNYLNTQCH